MTSPSFIQATRDKKQKQPLFLLIVYQCQIWLWLFTVFLFLSKAPRCMFLTPQKQQQQQPGPLFFQSWCRSRLSHLILIDMLFTTFSLFSRRRIAHGMSLFSSSDIVFKRDSESVFFWFLNEDLSFRRDDSGLFMLTIKKTSPLLGTISGICGDFDGRSDSKHKLSAMNCTQATC